MFLAQAPIFRNSCFFDTLSKAHPPLWFLVDSWDGLRPYPTYKAKRPAIRITFRITGRTLETILRDSGVHQCNGGIQHPVGEAPLVIVPGQHLDQISAHDAGLGGVVVGGESGVVEVHGDQRFVAVGQNAFQLAFGGGLEDLVDLFLAGSACRPSMYPSWI